MVSSENVYVRPVSWSHSSITCCVIYHVTIRHGTCWRFFNLCERPNLRHLQWFHFADEWRDGLVVWSDIRLTPLAWVQIPVEALERFYLKCVPAHCVNVYMHVDTLYLCHNVQPMVLGCTLAISRCILCHEGDITYTNGVSLHEELWTQTDY